jgi:hypothetical protein
MRLDNFSTFTTGELTFTMSQALADNEKEVPTSATCLWKVNNHATAYIDSMPKNALYRMG